MKIEAEPFELLENTLPKKKGQAKINKKVGGVSGGYDPMMEDSKVHETTTSGRG
jgi:hypothetical protein